MHRIMRQLFAPSVIKFLVVGVVSFGVDYTTLLVLNKVLAVQLNVATTIAFLVGLLINFTLNKLWTFEVRGGAKQSAVQAVEYGILVIINLAFTNVFISSLASQNFGPEVTKPIATGVVMITNYIVYKTIIFRKKSDAGA